MPRSVPQLNAAQQSYRRDRGSDYDCTPELLATRDVAGGAVCQPGNRQYDVLAGGDRGLEA